MIMLNLQSKDPEFNFWSSGYQVATTWMGDCLQTSKPSQYI